MAQFSVEREFGFLLSDVARLLRTYADQKAGEFGMTRAQWAVLFRLERSEGMKQSELAEILDIQPITLTRLIDRLCDNGLIERRSDPNDRRAKRLFLLPAATPVLAKLGVLGQQLISDALANLDRKQIDAVVSNLGTVKENLRQAIQSRADNAGDQRYG